MWRKCALSSSSLCTLELIRGCSFTSIGSSPCRHMITISICFASAAQRLPNAEVIPVDRIVQQCHLIPSFPRRAVNPRWIQGHALAEAQHFHLNKYMDLRTFKWYRLNDNVGMVVISRHRANRMVHFTGVLM